MSEKENEKSAESIKVESTRRVSSDMIELLEKWAK